MEVLEKFLRQNSYKFSKGYPDMSNPKDVLLLESMLSNVMGEKINISEKFKPLDFGDISRSGKEIRAQKIAEKIKNKELFELTNGEKILLDFTQDKYSDLFKNKKIDQIKQIGGLKINSFPFFKDENGKEYGLKDLVKSTELGGKGFVVGAHIEDREVESITKQLEELGPLDIKIGNKIYKGISRIDKPKGNPKADFILYNTNNNPEIYISHKEDGLFQQYSGISNIKDHPEVINFVKKVKIITKGESVSKNLFQRPIQDDKLKLDAVYGTDKVFSLNKVQIVIQGKISLVKSGKYYILKGTTKYEYPELPTGSHEPKLASSFRNNMNQGGVKNTRFGVYPQLYAKSAKVI